MKHNEREAQQSSPSMLQIRYLIELEKMGKKRGSVAQIAENCGVSHGPVSRYLKACVEKGYLDESYEFTDEGRVVLERYKRLLRETEEYLERIGTRKEDITEATRNLVENVDYGILGTIIRSDRNVKKALHPEHTGTTEKDFLMNVLRRGNWPVRVALFQYKRKTGLKKSMADRGFEHTAILRHNRRGSFLELPICRMCARSRIDGEELEGELSSLKYEHDGLLYQTDIKGGKVRIPLEACRIIKKSNGNIKGTVAVTVNCSVGQAHMPESTALLMFWL